MIVFSAKHKESNNEGGIHIMRERKNPGRHMLPHERKALINLEFEEEDMQLFHYENEDDMIAAVQVLRDAPPEIQILAVQLIDMIKEVV